MWTLGIDVAKRRHRATLLDDDGQTVFSNVLVVHSREGVDQLLQQLRRYAMRTTQSYDRSSGRGFVPPPELTQQLVLGLCVLMGLVISPAETVAGGRVEAHTFYSQVSGREQGLSVYLPPRYDDGPWSYPVIYGMPGCCGDCITPELQRDADRLIATGDIIPLIIVGVPKPLPSETYFYDELIPSVDEHFRTLRLRHHRAIYGHSASGTMPFALATLRPNLCSIIASFATGDWGWTEVPPNYDAVRFPLRSWIWHARNDDIWSFRHSETTAGRLEALGWEYTFYADDGGHCPGATARVKFLEYVSQAFAELPLRQAPRIDLSSNSPLSVGASVELTATVHPGLLVGESQTSEIAADLSALGGPTDVPLAPQADGTHRLTTSFPVEGLNGFKPVILRFTQGPPAQPYHFQIVRHPVVVYPTEERRLFADNVAAEWELTRVTVNPHATTHVFEGQTSLGVQPDFSFTLRLVLATPVEGFGYRLRFAFHPGEAQGSRFFVGVEGSMNSQKYSLIGGEEEGMSVDVEQKEWQVLEIPLLETTGVNKLIQSIVFSGSPQGTFYLDDIRLVPQTPPPATMAVQEDLVYRLRKAPTQDFTTIADSPPLSLDIEVVLEAPLEGTVPTLSLDLSAVGETDPLVLDHAGDGRYTARPRITLPQGSGVYRLPVLLSAGAVEPEFFFNIRLWAYPVEEWPLFADDLTPGWESSGVTLDPQATDPVFEGQTSLGVQSGLFFRFSWMPPEPVGALGYRLRFAFHPGEVKSGSTARFNVIFKGGVEQEVALIDDDPENIGVDLEHRDWQLVEIPLDLPDSKIQSIEFSGLMSGTFYLDDIRLVPETPPPPTAVLEDRQSTAPTDFTLEQNYPNPFNSGTVIRFDMAKTGEVELIVYNLTGQKVATLVSGVHQPGTYAIRWDGRDGTGRELSSGVYLYRLQAGKELVETRKMALVR